MALLSQFKPILNMLLCITHFNLKEVYQILDIIFVFYNWFFQFLFIERWSRTLKTSKKKIIKDKTQYIAESCNTVDFCEVQKQLICVHNHGEKLQVDRHSGRISDRLTFLHSNSRGSMKEKTSIPPAL